jgi:hypothetical protein
LYARWKVTERKEKERKKGEKERNREGRNKNMWIHVVTCTVVIGLMTEKEKYAHFVVTGCGYICGYIGVVSMPS